MFFFSTNCFLTLLFSFLFFLPFQNTLLSSLFSCKYECFTLFFSLSSLSDGNQGGPSFKDPLQVSVGPITRSRAKKIKEAMQGLVQSTWDEANKSPTIKVGLKEGEPILIHLIQVVEDMTQGSLGLLLFKALVQAYCYLRLSIY